MTPRAHTFATITDADWRCELRARRAAMDSNHRLGTALLAKVRQRIAAQQTSAATITGSNEQKGSEMPAERNR